MARKAASTTPSHKTRTAERPKQRTPASNGSRNPIGDHYRLEGTYERLRRALLEAPDDGRLDRMLSYWVLPTDRRLPIAFLDRVLRELLDQPLEELMQTPGVGHKKIMGFFDLLRRAHKAQSPHAPFGLSSSAPKDSEPEVSDDGRGRFDPASVSEAVWSEWCETVERVGLGNQKLGRIAPTLQPLPTVIWHTRLDAYSQLPLMRIRRLKTHGEKRVNAVLAVFHSAHEAVSTSVLHEHIELTFVPRFVPAVTAWLVEANTEPAAVTPQELSEHLVRPLVAQIGIDLGQPIAELVSERLPLDGQAPSIKQQADRLEVTRTRVYQLLEDCARVLQVRWPEGRWLLAPLAADPVESDPASLALIHTIRALFYPEERVLHPTEKTV